MLVQPAIRAGLEAGVHAAVERQVRQDEPVGPRVERDVEWAGRYSRRLPTFGPTFASLSSGGRESLERPQPLQRRRCRPPHLRAVREQAAIGPGCGPR